MNKLLTILGPTAVGKTNLALELAKKFNGELVSADSRQLYKGMDIGTGKLALNTEFKKAKDKWIVDGVPIYLYDLISPDQTFSLADYQQAAYKIIDGIIEKNKLPILVGGTGLYIRAITEGLKIPRIPPNEKLRTHLERKPKASLLRELEQVDLETFEKIDKQNLRRVVRALEVYYQTGEPLSALKGKFNIKYDSLKIGLTGSREYLYERADKQVEDWFQFGFVDEVKSLLVKGYKETDTSMTSLGYRQVIMFLNGKLSLEEAKQRAKWEQHAYIRRQLTWFRKEINIYWFNIEADNFRSKIQENIKKWLEEK